MKKAIIALTIALLALVAVRVAHAQTAPPCDTAAAPTTSVCSDQNGLFITFPTTSTDGSPLNDYANTVVFFGPNAGVCTTPIAAGTKNLGNLSVPATPAPNTKVRVPLGQIGMAKGKNFVGVKLADLAGNASPCSPEIQFTYDPIAPNTVTISVGP